MYSGYPKHNVWNLFCLNNKSVEENTQYTIAGAEVQKYNPPPLKTHTFLAEFFMDH